MLVMRSVHRDDTNTPWWRARVFKVVETTAANVQCNQRNSRTGETKTMDIRINALFLFHLYFIVFME